MSKVPVWQARGTHPRRLFSKTELHNLEPIDKTYVRSTRARIYPLHKSKYKTTGKHDYPKDVGDVFLDARSGRLIYPYHDEIQRALSGARKGIKDVQPRRRYPTI